MVAVGLILLPVHFPFNLFHPCLSLRPSWSVAPTWTWPAQPSELPGSRRRLGCPRPASAPPLLTWLQPLSFWRASHPLIPPPPPQSLRRISSDLHPHKCHPLSKQVSHAAPSSSFSSFSSQQLWLSHITFLLGFEDFKILTWKWHSFPVESEIPCGWAHWTSQGECMVGNQRDRVRPIASGLWFPSEFTLLVDLLSVVCVTFEQASLASPSFSFQICQDKNCTHLTGSLEDCFWSDESRAPPTPSATALVVTGGAQQALVVTGSAQ